LRECCGWRKCCGIIGEDVDGVVCFDGGYGGCLKQCLLIEKYAHAGVTEIFVLMVILKLNDDAGVTPRAVKNGVVVYCNICPDVVGVNEVFQIIVADVHHQHRIPIAVVK